MQLSSRIFANVWRKIRESFAKVNGPPASFLPDMRPTGPLVCCRAACELELGKRASRAELKTGDDFRAGAAEVYFAYYFRIEKPAIAQLVEHLTVLVRVAGLASACAANHTHTLVAASDTQSLLLSCSDTVSLP